MTALVRTFRFAARRLLHTPVFSITAVATLAIGIGANALIFSVVNGVLLKPLPFAEPDGLVGVWHTAPGLGWDTVNQGPATYLLYREEGRVFEDIGIWDDTSVSITGLAEPERVEALLVTDGTLPVLRVVPRLGRRFTPEDDSPGTPETVMLTDAYWQRAFGGAPDAVGRVLVVDGRPREIIGVLPATFQLLSNHPAVLLPMRINRAEVFVGNFSYQALARLKPGATIEQANADIARLIPSLPDRFPMPPGFTWEMFQGARFGPLVRPLAEDAVGDVGRVLWILFGTVGIVLLIACANVANLFLVRAEGRQQELAIHTALGAGWSRLAGGLLSESLLLGLAGGALGLALAAGGLRLLVAIEPGRLPRLEDVAIDPIVVLFTVAVSVAGGLLFGMIPVLKYAKPQLSTALKEGGRGSSDGRERHRARNGLVVAQVALALVLLVGSGLMVRTFLALRHLDPGFTRPEEVLTFRVSIPSAVAEDPAEAALMHEQIARRLEAIPGVSSVGPTSSVTMDGWDSNDPIFVEEFPTLDGQIPKLRRFKWVAEGYFETMGNPIVAGRSITWADVHSRANVAVVSEHLAREYWPDPAQAIGKRIRTTPNDPWREIVGVAGAERDDGVTEPAPTIVYWPMALEHFWEPGLRVQRNMAYAVRSPRLAAPTFLQEIQQAVWSVNPNLPVANVRTLQQLLDRSLARASFALVMLGVAAAVALVLGLVGIYGVIAYIVTQRTREIGIRMALGARQEDVRRLFLRHGLLLTGVGLAAGLVVSVALMRLMSALLFGVSPVDPLTYAAVSVGLAAVALLASYLPARRAAGVDPAVALRAE